MLQKDVRYLFEHLSPLIFVHLPLFFIRRPRFCLDMVSSGGLTRLPRSRHLGPFGTLLGPLPKRPLYLSSDGPHSFRVLSSLPLASDFASGLNVTVLTSLKSFKHAQKELFWKSAGNACEKFTLSARGGPTHTDPCWCSRAWSSCLCFHWRLYRRNPMQQSTPCVCDATSQHEQPLRQRENHKIEKKKKKNLTNLSAG